MAVTPTTASGTSSIVKTLGSGSGLDTAGIVSALVEAQFAAKTGVLAKRQESLVSRISGLSTLRSAVTGLDAALSSLVGSGTLASALTSSAPTSVKATATAGADLSGLNAKIGVTQLADAQVVSTNTAVARTGAWQTGTLTLRMGRDVVNASGVVTGFTPAAGGSIAIPITSADATLDGIAAKINATAGVAATGVVASVVEDGAGARLVLRGASGGDKAFELAVSGTSGGGAPLTNLAVSRTSTVTTAGTRARDAVVTVDGVRYARPTNSVEGVVAGVKLDLLAPTTTPAALFMARPTESLSAAVNDFAGAFNEVLATVKASADPVTGVLRADPAVAGIARALRQLTTTSLTTGGAAGAPRTLADLGVATARDGTLTVDAARLKAVLAQHPAAVEAMFAAGAGLPAAVGRLKAQATSTAYGLDAASKRYSQEMSKIAGEQDKLAVSSEQARVRMTRQFAGMDARVAAYKSTQTFLQGQIDAWNRDD